MSTEKKTGLKLHAEYDSGVISVNLADYEKQRQVHFRVSLNDAAWPHGRAIDLSEWIEEIKWKEKPNHPNP